MSIFSPFYFKGSETGDIPSDFDDHPFSPCPDSPNCIAVSKKYNQNPNELFSLAKRVLENMNPHQIEVNSEEGQLTAVFRIPVFLFKDDFEVVISANDASSTLHIKSSSRVGHGDLGVNRRRVQKFLSLLNNQL